MRKLLSGCGVSKFYHYYATTPTPTTTLYADFSRLYEAYLFNSAGLVISLVAFKGAKSQLQQEMTYGGVAPSRIRPLTRLVGKFSKVVPKKQQQESLVLYSVWLIVAAVCLHSIHKPQICLLSHHPTKVGTRPFPKKGCGPRD